MKTTQIESLIKNLESQAESNIKIDKYNICTLFVLYTLQGIPLGFSLAIPIIMQSIHSSSFKDQVSKLLNRQLLKQ